MKSSIKKKHTNLPKVVLLGRANVGKSTLFNKLTEKYVSMVSEVAGTTRDIKDAVVHWQKHTFEIIDTGGLTTPHLTKTKKRIEEDADDMEAFIDKHIVKQALEAVDKADLILFVVDSYDEVHTDDIKITKWLKKHTNQKIVLVANKADNDKLKYASADFYQLGIGDPIPVSASSGSGLGDLLDIITEHIPIVEEHRKVNYNHEEAQTEADESVEDEIKTIEDAIKAKKNTVKSKEDLKTDEFNKEPKDTSPINVAIIGRPNVGKSSLLNAIIGEERVIVSSQAHTTREPIDTEFEYSGRTITLIDTAGIRRKARIPFKSLEKESVALSLKSIKRADVVVLVVDGSELGKQDLKLAEEALKQRVALIIIINKIDLIKEALHGADHIKVKKGIQHTFNFIKWAPVMLLSATTGKNVHKVLDQIIEVYKNYKSTLKPKELNELLREFVTKRPAPKKIHAKRRPFVVGMRQIATEPPHFEVTYKGKGMLPLTYLNYLEKGLRERYDFSGTPIIIHQFHIKGKHDC